MTEDLVDLLWAADEAMVDHVVEWEHGTALSTPALPLIWDLNSLRVESDPGDAGAVVAAADRHQGAYTWRKAYVRDADLGERLAPGLEALGWKATRQLVGVWDAPVPAPVEGAGETEAAVAAAFRAASRREGGAGEEEVRQMAEMDRRAVHRLAGREFCAPAAAPDAGCRLHSHGKTAQVEDVGTRPSARRRGLARAVVLTAVSAAFAAGHDRVFIVADEDDWPSEWYRRLGFRTVGWFWEAMPARPRRG